MCRAPVWGRHSVRPVWSCIVWRRPFRVGVAFSGDGRAGEVCGHSGCGLRRGETCEPGWTPQRAEAFGERLRAGCAEECRGFGGDRPVTVGCGRERSVFAGTLHGAAGGRMFLRCDRTAVRFCRVLRQLLPCARQGCRCHAETVLRMRAMRRAGCRTAICG